MAASTAYLMAASMVNAAAFLGISCASPPGICNPPVVKRVPAAAVPGVMQGGYAWKQGFVIVPDDLPDDALPYVLGHEAVHVLLSRAGRRSPVPACDEVLAYRFARDLGGPVERQLRFYGDQCRAAQEKGVVKPAMPPPAPTR